MVVLAIVGIMASLVVGMLRPDPARAVEAEAWRLARLAERLGREAALSGQVLALRWTPSGYEFLRRGDRGDWTPLAADGVFDRRRFEPGLRLADSGEARFTPDGEIEPRRWWLSADSVDLTISLDALGEATVARREGAGASR